MQLLNSLFKKKNRKTLPQEIPKGFESNTGHTKVEWRGPKYIVGFPNEEKPFIPYYHIEGQDGQWIEAPSSGFFYHDPIEDCLEFKKIDSIVDQMVDKELGNRKNLMGSCHCAWAIKKRILKEQYGIDWKSIAELNPLCTFD